MLESDCCCLPLLYASGPAPGPVPRVAVPHGGARWRWRRGDSRWTRGRGDGRVPKAGCPPRARRGGPLATCILEIKKRARGSHRHDDQHPKYDSLPLGRGFIFLHGPPDPPQEVSLLVPIAFLLLGFNGLCAVSWGLCYPGCYPIKILIDAPSPGDSFKILPGAILLPQLLPQHKKRVSQNS